MAEGVRRGSRGGKSGKALRASSRRNHYQLYKNAGIREKNKERKVTRFMKKAIKLGWFRENESANQFLMRSTSSHYRWDDKANKAVIWHT